MPALVVLGGLLVVGLLVTGLALLIDSDPTPGPVAVNPGVVTLVVDPGDARADGLDTPDPAPDVGPTVTLASDKVDAVPTTALPGSYSHDFESDDGLWPLGTSESELGVYESSLVGGKYRVTYSANRNSVLWRCLREYEFEDFSLSVEATPVEGPVPFAYGIAFRKQSGEIHLYELRVNNKSEYRINLKKDEWEPLIDWTTSTAIRPEGSNRLEIEAIGPRLRFTVNDQFLNSAIDTTWTGGGICFFVWSSEGNTATVDFDNLVIHAR